MVISEAIPAPCEPLVTELARRTLALAQDAYVWALNLSCVRSPSKQCKSVLSIARSATRIATRFDGTASAKFVLDDILLRRVKEIDVWSEHDNLLQEIVQQTPVPTNLDQETTSALLTAVHNKSALRTPSLLVKQLCANPVNVLICIRRKSWSHTSIAMSNICHPRISA
jgi:hypothetical protein